MVERTDPQLPIINNSRTPRYYDVDGDDFVAANDVLSIINYINAHSGAQQESGNSTPPASFNPAATDDALLLLLANTVSQPMR
jgi:hypothetical protein